MIKPPRPADEATRLAALRGLNILDTPPEERFDRITRTALRLFNLPVALVSLVDENRQWFKSCQGLAVTETERCISFCAHAILGDETLIIPDALSDPRFADNPLVTGEPYIRFYAGQPLRALDGTKLGTLCIIDSQPRRFSQSDREALCDLATWAENELNNLNEQHYRALFAEAHRHAQELALLEQVRNALGQGFKLEEVFRLVVEGIAQTFGYNLVSLYLLHNQVLTLQHQVGYPKVITQIPVDQGVSGRVISSGQPVFLKDVRNDPDFLGAIEGVISEICVPLLHQHRAVGTLNVESTQGVVLTEADLQLMVALSTQISLAIERKQAEEALRESEARNRAFLNAIPDMMFRLSSDGTYLDFKGEKEATVSIPPSSFLGKKLTEVLPPEVAQQTIRCIQQAIATGETQVIEYQVIVDDKVCDREARIVVSGEDELLSIVRDITERKKVDRLKSDFISTVSHELRTPLTSIRGSLGLIMGGVAGDVPATAKAMLDIAYKNSERLVRLINDILDMEKIETGKMVFDFKPVELMPLIEQALEANRAYGEQYRVNYCLTETLPGVKVNVDGDRLLQVLANLLSNAAKFSPAGEVVDVSVTCQGKAIRIAVSDRGPGIPEEFRSRMFQKFAQADSSNTRQKGGTGLGLSISKAIVEKLGGELAFESGPAGGTIFYFDLPQWRDPAVLAQPLAPPPPRILICEDDADVSNLLNIILRHAGFTTDMAHSAAQAKTLLAKNEYAALTLDLMLPDQDGISLIQELREQEATRGLPVVVVSANAETDRKKLHGNAPAVADWINKPIDQKRLVMTVKQATRQTTSTRPRILHVEDDPDILHIVAVMLEEEAVELSSARNLKAARQMLARKHFDLVILDLSLPDGSGLDLLPLLQDNYPWPVPVVIFSVRDLTVEVAQKVSAVLVKSRTSNQELVTTIKTLIEHSCLAIPEPTV